MRNALAFALLASLGVACSDDPVASESPANGQTEDELAVTRLPVNVAVGNKIADIAVRVNGRSSGGRCLYEVQNSLDRAGVKAFPRLPGAVDLDNFMMAKGAGLSAWGFQKQTLPIDQIPRGSIIAWRPSQCGYHATYGHIEIATGNGRACSDFCGAIKTTCGAPNIYVPIMLGIGNSAVAAGTNTDVCKVEGDEKKLHCNNKENVALRAGPSPEAPIVNHLKTTYSWFECWTRGEADSKGNSTWYRTVGDENKNVGWAHSAELETTDDFDANPTARGLAKCTGPKTIPAK